MRVELNGLNIELTAALRDYVNNKFQKISTTENITSIRIVLSVEKILHKAEATIRIAHHEDIYALSVTEDIYASIDLLVDKIDKQLVKLKERHITANRQTRARAYEA